MLAIKLDPLVYPGEQTSLVTNTKRGDTKQLKIVGRFLSASGGYVDVYPEYISAKTRLRFLSQLTYDGALQNDVNVELPDASRYYFVTSGYSGNIFGDFGRDATNVQSAAGSAVAIAPIDIATLANGTYGVSITPDTITGDVTGESVDCLNSLDSETMYVYAMMNVVDVISGDGTVFVQQSVDEVTWSSALILTQVGGHPIETMTPPMNGCGIASFVRTARYVRVCVDLADGSEILFAASILRIPQGG